MRLNARAALVMLLLPVGMSAQLLPPLGGRLPIPTRPEPGPRQPPAIARELAYKRMRVSFESYPLLSYVQSPRVAGGVVVPNRTSFGFGTRADYRMTRFASATLDVTSAFLGSAAITETAEIGVRLRPERSERKVYPFVDVRVGFLNVYNGQFPPFDAANGGRPLYGARYSQGVGGLGGAGFEYTLTRRFSLTTAASVMRSRMTPYGPSAAPQASGPYSMTSYRLMVGLRYNPVRLLSDPPT